MCIQAYSNTNGYLGTSSETGEGSGIIASSDGYIITNAHVIEGASALKVILSDGTSLSGNGGRAPTLQLT